MRIQIDLSESKHRQHLADATLIDGVVRWESNGTVPPKEYVQKAVDAGHPVDVAKCNEVRDTELRSFLSDYRKNYKGPSEETRAEARAAFGPDHEIVNIITGHKWRT